MNAVQWAPHGLLNAVPGEILRLLAEDGKTFGYAPSEGWSFTFYHPNGDVKVEPGQWVTRHDDGSIAVTDEHPAHVNTEHGGAYARAAALAAGDPNWMDAMFGTERSDAGHAD